MVSRPRNHNKIRLPFGWAIEIERTKKARRRYIRETRMEIVLELISGAVWTLNGSMYATILYRLLS